jgi:quercetin dioxygenase-like cupin family protein
MIFKSILGAACLLSVSAITPAFAASQEHADSMSHAILLQRPSDAKFMAVPGVPECTTLAPLHGDMSKGPSTLMVRMTAGCMVPYHWHTPSEEMVVLQGAALSQMRGERPVALKVGAYTQLPSPHAHRFRCTSKVDCLFFLVADAAFDIHFVDDAGKEISTEAALAAAKKNSGQKW